MLGTDGTIRKASLFRRLPQRFNAGDREERPGTGRLPQHAPMADFFWRIRQGREPAGPFELGFRVSIACRMAVNSGRQGCSVAWHPQREEIV